MASVRRIRAFGLALVALISGVSLAAQGDLAAIQQRLYEQFKLTTTTADRSDIVTAGDVVTIHKPGLVMFSGTAVPSTNNYSEAQAKHSKSQMGGSIGQGFGTILIMSNPNTVQRQFVPGEKFWVTGIQVQKDGALFMLCSDPYNGLRYYGNLKILFPDKKVVPPVDSFMQTIAEVLTVDGQNEQPEPAQPGRIRPAIGDVVQVPGIAPPPTPAPAPAPAPAPLPEIAPPPPPGRCSAADYCPWPDRGYGDRCFRATAENREIGREGYLLLQRYEGDFYQWSRKQRRIGVCVTAKGAGRKERRRNEAPMSM